MKIIRGVIYLFLVLLLLQNIQNGVISFNLIFFLMLLVFSIPVIPFSYRKYKERKLLKQMAKAGIHEIDKMDGYQFETYLKALYKELGFKSDITQAAADFGADLVMRDNNKKVVIQAKRYGYQNKVSIGAIQEVYSAIPYYKADQGIVITNSYYTAAARKLAKACKVRLLDRKDLISFIKQINPSFEAGEIRRTVAAENRPCPLCNGELIQRTSHNGNHFMGCSNYPKCKHTENVAIQ